MDGWLDGYLHLINWSSSLIFLSYETLCASFSSVSALMVVSFSCLSCSFSWFNWVTYWWWAFSS